MLSLALRIIPAERVYNFVARCARGSQADCDFALVINLSFYRFSIRSCVATSRKQILKTPFSMASSCFLGFQATRSPTWAHFILFILCLLYVGKSPGESQSISEANNSGLQTQQYPIGRVAGIPCRGRFNTERT